ncbi:hypothetical protein IFM89_033983 [Coptis chinensis]|uniref:J domain-containing protein n=1 Tax=Coptis chinensis TaxID=261450 RepID=A0A835M7N4_9MAGN|nr:hypothetical protein IFM89_033983 [Coptis chinensis]
MSSFSSSSSSHFLGPKISVLNHKSSSSTAPDSIRFKPHRISAVATSTERPTSRYLTFNLNSSPSSLYEVLGLSMGASCQEIKTAYRKLARVCHPDVASMDQKDTSADEFIKIHAAYSTLSDPQKRADYDRKLFNRRSPFSYATSSPIKTSGYTNRRSNWETDQCW